MLNLSKAKYVTPEPSMYNQINLFSLLFGRIEIIIFPLRYIKKIGINE